MSVETKYTPYDYVLTVGNESSWIELSVSKSRYKGGYPIANIATSCCKFSTINVPLTLFADIQVDGLWRNYYSDPELRKLQLYSPVMVFGSSVSLGLVKPVLHTLS